MVTHAPASGAPAPSVAGKSTRKGRVWRIVVTVPLIAFGVAHGRIFSCLDLHGYANHGCAAYAN
jgi:hypothetical protein